MSKPKFTPGPWHIERDVKIDQSSGEPWGVWFNIIAEPGALPIEPVGAEGITDEANARLIAAAPDMYEALEKVVSALSGRVHSRDALNAVGMAEDIVKRIRGAQ